MDAKRTREHNEIDEENLIAQKMKFESCNLNEMRYKLDSLGQSHIYEQLKDFDAKHPIFEQLSKLDIAASIDHFTSAKATSLKEGTFTSVNEHRVFDYRNDENSSDKLRVEQIGMQAIIDGTVAAVIMSGGQGTRLGFDGPKGMYNMGLISGKSIFQLHVERILKIKELCTQNNTNNTTTNNTINHNEVHIPIYIMTSDLNHSIIQDYFAVNHYFGYPQNDIIFFEQGLEPAFTQDGKIIIESSTTLSLSPDGNGGIYKALQRDCIADMTSRGILHLHIFGIDNVLTKSLDPLFIGTCIVNEVQVGNKVVWRAHASEKVGVTAELDSKMHILEYSEIPLDYGARVDSHGKLIYGAANICNHYLSIDFLKHSVFRNLSNSYHFANKKIKYYDPLTQQSITPSEPNGVKLEMFIFDVFPLADKWCVVEVEREDEFAPVKNQPGALQDSPDTAREMISNQGIKWLESAGAIILNKPTSTSIPTDHTTTKIDHNNMCEISPLVSYAGEGLEEYKGKEIALPCYLKRE